MTPVPTELGALDRTEDGWTITFTRHLPHPPEKVWRAITEPEHLAAWFPDEIVGERATGAPLKFMTSTGEGFEGEMLRYEPPSVMEMRWGTDRLRFELEPDGDGTRMTLVDSFAELGKAARDAAGWHECLDRLDHVLDGTEPLAWGAPWTALAAAYAERYGPDASTIGPPPDWEPPSG